MTPIEAGKCDRCKRPLPPDRGASAGDAACSIAHRRDAILLRLASLSDKSAMVHGGVHGKPDSKPPPKAESLLLYYQGWFRQAEAEDSERRTWGLCIEAEYDYACRIHRIPRYEADQTDDKRMDRLMLQYEGTHAFEAAKLESLYRGTKLSEGKIKEYRSRAGREPVFGRRIHAA